MVRREIIPFRPSLNKIPPKEDALAIVPILDPLPLSIIAPTPLLHCHHVNAIGNPTSPKLVSERSTS